MLKIKDNVNLKELESLGFHKGNYAGGTFWIYNIACDDGFYVEIVVNVNRAIWLDVNCEDFSVEDIDIIFDLIQAGLVEKVADKGE